MSTLIRNLKHTLIAGSILILGFIAGWTSSSLLGGRIPLTGDVMQFWGPGLFANQGSPAELRQQFSVFWEVWNLVESEYYGRARIDRSRMIQGAIKGMMGTLDDQYTVYQEPDLAAQTNDHMQGTLGGIGAYLQLREGRVYLNKIFPDSPAQKAGLLKEDEITHADGQDLAALIIGLDINQSYVKVMARIRGPEGTPVALKIRRGERTFDVTLQRANIVVPSVESQMLPDSVAYIRISEFKSNTTREFDEALRDLLPRKPRGLILDLRNNPGGFLSNAQEVLGRFYSGVALYEEDSGEIKELRTIAGDGETRVFDLPVVVLVNAGSASASEIVAGALRDTRPTTYLLGEKTYGKGSVQNIHNLSDGGSARITIAHWLTPSKGTIHKVGITPQYVVPYNEEPVNQVPCVAERQPAEGQTACADSQLSWAIRLLVKGESPPDTPAATR